MSIPVQVTTRPFRKVPLSRAVDVVGGYFGEMAVSEMVGRYFNLTLAGMVFAAVTTSQLSNSASTSIQTCYWNLESSGVLMVPIRFMLGYAGAATGVLGGFAWNGIPNAGSHVGTGHPITTFTDNNTPPSAAAMNQFFGGPSSTSFDPISSTLGQATKIRVGNPATISGARSLIRGMAMSQQAPVTTGTSILPPLIEDFDGTFIIAPGGFIVPCEVGAASGDNFNMTLIWAEIPLS